MFHILQIIYIDIFYNLISKTGSRDDFHPYSKEYYENFYKIFNKEGKAEVFISYIYPKKILKGIELLKEIANSFFIQDCSDLHECMFCSHISSKRFCIANMQFTEKEYYEIKKLIIEWIINS